MFSEKNRKESKQLQCVKDRVIREHAFCVQPRIYVFLKMLKENVLKFLTVTTVREKVVAIKYPILLKVFIYLFLVALGLLAVCWHSLVEASGGCFSLVCGLPSHCDGFSCCREQAPGIRASVIVGTGLVAQWHVESAHTRD